MVHIWLFYLRHLQSLAPRLGLPLPTQIPIAPDFLVLPPSWPSYNIAVLKCQIDLAPLTSSLFHVPHIPSNRTPATLV